MAGAAFAQEGGETILDTTGFWRVYITLRTPVVRDGEEVAEIGSKCDTDAPPKEWNTAGFDDSAWIRMAGAPFCSWSHWLTAAQLNVGFISHNASSLALATLYMRGNFAVKDPAKVGELKFSMIYRGGAVVYVNGKEIARGHIARDAEIQPETLAENYPPAAYYEKNGKIMDCRTGDDNMTTRLRALENVTVPVELLHKGVNVLAVEIHRSALPQDYYDRIKGATQEIGSRLWDACGLHSMRLVAPAAGEVAQNAVRPQGVQAWNSDVMVPDASLDWGNPNDKLLPVRIVGARNGAFSGKVVVGSSGAIKNIEASISDFASAEGAKIEAQNALIRYAVPGAGANIGYYPAFALHLGDLLEEAPAAVDVMQGEISNRVRPIPGAPAPVFGAVVPVWITVKVPQDAQKGEYAAALAVNFEGAEEMKIPVKLTVCGFKLPPPQEYQTFVELVQSPDTLAARYGVPLWSDKHWELIEKSLKLTGEAGAKTCYVPLIYGTNLGNDESMVRWVKEGDNKYKYDLSIMDKYLGLVEECQGRPKVVCLCVWDNFLEGGRFAGDLKFESQEVQQDRLAYRGKGPEVTVVNGGAVAKMQLPPCSNPDAKTLWAPLCREIVEALKRRGYGEEVMVGMATDTMPSKNFTDFWKEMLPDAKWVRHAHPHGRSIHGVPCGYCTGVWGSKFISYSGTSACGWKEPLTRVQFARNMTDYYPLTTYRLIAEHNVGGSQCGFGRVGADFWRAVRLRDGEKSDYAYVRFPKSNWRNLNIKSGMLGAGPKGAVATARFEAMREGIEETEARIFIERAIDGGKIGGELAERYKAIVAKRNKATVFALDPHTMEGFMGAGNNGRVHGWWNNPGRMGYYWFLLSGYRERSRELYSLAGEIQKITESQ